MVLSLLDYDDDGNLIQSTLIPIVDGGTEGFKGNARVILPGMTACVECTLDLFPPQVCRCQRAQSWRQLNLKSPLGQFPSLHDC